MSDALAVRVVDNLASIHVWSHATNRGLALVNEQEAKRWCSAAPIMLSRRTGWWSPGAVVRKFLLTEHSGWFDPLNWNLVREVDLLLIHACLNRDPFRELVTDDKHGWYVPLFLRGSFLL